MVHSRAQSPRINVEVSNSFPSSPNLVGISIRPRLLSQYEFDVDARRITRELNGFTKSQPI